MTDMEILQLADSCGVMAVTKHEWDGKQFNHTDDYLDGDAAALVIFARELLKKRDAICQAIESEKQQPSGDKYTSFGLMGGDKFVNEDSLKRNIT